MIRESPWFFYFHLFKGHGFDGYRKQSTDHWGCLCDVIAGHAPPIGLELKILKLLAKYSAPYEITDTRRSLADQLSLVFLISLKSTPLRPARLRCEHHHPVPPNCYIAKQKVAHRRPHLAQACVRTCSRSFHGARKAANSRNLASHIAFQALCNLHKVLDTRNFLRSARAHLASSAIFKRRAIKYVHKHALNQKHTHPSFHF